MYLLYRNLKINSGYGRKRENITFLPCKRQFQFKLIFMLKKYSRVISFTLTTNEQF